MKSARMSGSPGSAFYNDCNGPRQGISVGWSDEYPYSLADQYVVINPGGKYVGDGGTRLLAEIKSLEDSGSGFGHVVDRERPRVNKEHNGRFPSIYDGADEIVLSAYEFNRVAIP